ncbi:hypothetical protein V1511DRAFT_5482 [Dipodascopsis uninucleata]
MKEMDVYIRLPFPRNGFVDPEMVHFDISEERRIWNEIFDGTLTDLGSSSNYHSPTLDRYNNEFIMQYKCWLFDRYLIYQQRRIKETQMKRALENSQRDSSRASGVPLYSGTHQLVSSFVNYSPQEQSISSTINRCRSLLEEHDYQLSRVSSDRGHQGPLSSDSENDTEIETSQDEEDVTLEPLFSLTLEDRRDHAAKREDISGAADLNSKTASLNNSHDSSPL